METDDDGLRPQNDASDAGAPARCQWCGGAPAWESISDSWGERWLASCSCGRLEAFFPDRVHPEEQPPDPLMMFLQGHRGPRRPATPAWIRLFLNSAREPYATRWRHDLEPCTICETQTTFGLLAWLHTDTATVCTLCLNCGYVTTRNEKPGYAATEPLLDGTKWTPACPAVKRLRRCVYQRPRFIADSFFENP